jgi:hypothetical protein
MSNFEGIINRRANDKRLQFVAVSAIIAALVSVVVIGIGAFLKIEEMKDQRTVVFPDGQTFRAGVYNITPELRKLQYNQALLEGLRLCFQFDEGLSSPNALEDQMEKAENYFPQYAARLKASYESQELVKDLKAYSIKTRIYLEEDIRYSYDQNTGKMYAQIKAIQVSQRPKGESSRRVYLTCELQDLVSINTVNTYGVQFVNVVEEDFSIIKK